MDPGGENDLTVLIEARHRELEDALRSGEQMIVSGEPFGPRLHISMHQLVAGQLLAGDPPETWQTARRLTGLGYDWLNILHMISAMVSDGLYQAVTGHRQFDPGDHAQRLNDLPGG